MARNGTVQHRLSKRIVAKDKKGASQTHRIEIIRIDPQDFTCSDAQCLMIAAKCC